MVGDIPPNTAVKGKGSLAGKTGVIIGLERKQGPTRTNIYYKIRWDDGLTKSVTTRSFEVVQEDLSHLFVNSTTNTTPQQDQEQQERMEILENDSSVPSGDAKISNPIPSTDVSTESETLSPTIPVVTQDIKLVITNTNETKCLKVNDVQWKEIGGNTTVNLMENSAIYRRGTKFKYPTLHALPADQINMTPADYFQYIFPINRIQDIVEATYNNMKAEKRNCAPLNKEELVRWIGITLATSFYKDWKLRDLWEVEAKPNDFRTPPNFEEKFNMTRTRFEFIRKHIQWAHWIQEDENKD